MTRIPRSDNSDKHNYLKPSFWVDPASHFWETAMYSEASKDYYRKFVQRQFEIVERKSK